MDDYTKGALSVWRGNGIISAEVIGERFLSYVKNESAFLNRVDSLGQCLPQLESAFKSFCWEMEIPFAFWEDAWAEVCNGTLKKSA